MEPEYKESIEEATQIARSALPLASQFKLPANPVNYAVFYEYISGQNPDLNQALDQMRENPENLTVESVHSLYQQFISQTDEQVILDLRQALGKIVEVTQQSLQRVGEESRNFQSGLNSGVQRLNDVDNAQELVKIVADLVNETKQMQVSSQSLSDELDKANNELTDLREDFQRVRRESLVDPLTGTQNRRAFDKTIDQLCLSAKEEDTPLCMLMVDIDHFKKFNDTFGHVTGDAVIKWVAKTIQNTIRGADVLARYGGEEFAILLPETPVMGGGRVAENICNSIRNQKLHNSKLGQDIGSITVSIGVSQYQSGEATDQLVIRSDEALYSAKESGRDRVCLEQNVNSVKVGSVG